MSVYKQHMETMKTIFSSNSTAKTLPLISSDLLTGKSFQPLSDLTTTLLLLSMLLVNNGLYGLEYISFYP